MYVRPGKAAATLPAVTVASGVPATVFANAMGVISVAKPRSPAEISFIFIVVF